MILFTTITGFDQYLNTHKNYLFYVEKIIVLEEIVYEKK